MPSSNDRASSDHMSFSHRQHSNATTGGRRCSGPDPSSQFETTTSTAPSPRYPPIVETPPSVAFTTPIDHHAPVATQLFDQPHRDRFHASHPSDLPPPFGRQGAHARSLSLQSHDCGHYGQEPAVMWPSHGGYQPDEARPPSIGYRHAPLQMPDQRNSIPTSSDRYPRGSTNTYDPSYQSPPTWSGQHPGDERLDSSAYQHPHRLRPLVHTEHTHGVDPIPSAPSTSHRAPISLMSSTPHLPTVSSSGPTHQSHDLGIDANESDTEKESTAFPCQFCSITCSRKTDLLRHIRDRHSAVPHKEVCPYCGIEVGRMDALRRHIRVTCKLNPRRVAEGADQDAGGKKGKGKERRKNDE